MITTLWSYSPESVESRISRKGVISMKFLSAIMAIGMIGLACMSCRQDRNEPLFELLSQEQTGITFQNTLSYDKDFNIYTYRNFYNGGGVGIGDVNNDGRTDLMLREGWWEQPSPDAAKTWKHHAVNFGDGGAPARGVPAVGYLQILVGIVEIAYHGQSVLPYRDGSVSA